MNNKESYSVVETVEYYSKLYEQGFFSYEEQLVKKYFSKGSRVVDLGCGAGRTTMALKKMGFEVTGIDYSPSMIKAAKILDPVTEYHVEDVRNMSFRSETFDCAMFSFNGLMLIESFEDRKKAILEIKRVLKSGGVFLFTTPFLDNKIGRGYWAEKVTAYNKPLDKFTENELMELGDDITDEDGVEFHLHIPFVNEIKKMLDECGYGIIFEGRRLDNFPEEEMEDELDDNYLWVVINRNV